ncbi:MAG: DUF6314 family protein [Pseudomonadota bacterium]
MFESWSGEWTLDREISPGFHFEGTATFEVLTESAYLLRESGLLQRADSPPMNAARSWHWEVSDENQLKISYDENPPRLYHALNLQFVEARRTWVGQDLHLCEPDEYDGDYILGEKKLESIQTVSGPNKAYRVHSIFQR